MDPKPAFFRLVDLVGEKPVTPAEAEANRAAERWPVNPREGRRGMLPIAPSTLWRKVKAGEFPAPTKFGGVTVWRADEIHAWIEAQRAPQPQRAAALPTPQPRPAPAPPRPKVAPVRAPRRSPAQQQQPGAQA